MVLGFFDHWSIMIFGRGGGAKEAVFTTDTDENQAVLVEI
jgi:hypothetical protein